MSQVISFILDISSTEVKSCVNKTLGATICSFRTLWLIMPSAVMHRALALVLDKAPMQSPMLHRPSYGYLKIKVPCAAVS